jgi:hypothetical protein
MLYSPTPNFSATMAMTPPNEPGSVGGMDAMPRVAMILDFLTSCEKCAGNSRLVEVIARLLMVD